ncbi:Small-conductance mechanosensitive channel [Neorhodopirellula lusitana]|uniref:Small-conductance mechanosensitive channel n=1 Tax=Neorhodopirellula lusitana TaxID=445327 RepID=A0ABY1Q4J5_9BACT|nr:mechanosensitive ion channel family protein [Neorhodopirellula lusitana]SMP59228.1 Small-conductance mechanosensitive channel [Neorhodopirellula lusitana]
MSRFLPFLLLFQMVVPLSAQEDASEEEEIDKNAPAATVAVDDVVDDASIEERLSQVFRAAGWFDEMSVVTDNGIVTIEGTSDSEEHSQWATNVARKTQDVIAVINKLEVKSVVDLSSSKDTVQKSLDTLWRDFLVRSPLLAAAVFLLFLTGLLAKLVGWTVSLVFQNRKMRTSLKDLILQLTFIAVWIVGLLAASVVAFPGMTPAKALTVLGLGSVAIGFAFKDIFENFFAGVLILWRYPFDRGDFISCEGVTGKVDQITIRNTMIRQLDGELAVVPNATLFKNNVDVLTDQPYRRVRLTCGVAYSEDIENARQVITEAVQSCDTIEGIRTVQVFAKEFADSSVNFEVSWWTGSKPTEMRRSRDQVVSAIKRYLDDAAIEIPFPYRTLTFKSPADAAALAGGEA